MVLSILYSGLGEFQKSLPLAYKAVDKIFESFELNYVILESKKQSIPEKAKLEQQCN